MTVNRERSRLDIVAMISAPVIVTVLFAAALFVALPERTSVGETVILPPPSDVLGGAAGIPLPNASLEEITSRVEATTGHAYQCEGPWTTSDGFRNWSCRTPDALAILRGRDQRSINALQVTWFGFDPRSTDLPAWAAATQLEPGRQAAIDWVERHSGGSHVGLIDGVKLATAGARGALTLSVGGS